MVLPLIPAVYDSGRSGLYRGGADRPSAAARRLTPRAQASLKDPANRYQASRTESEARVALTRTNCSRAWARIVRRGACPRPSSRMC